MPKYLYFGNVIELSDDAEWVAADASLEVYEFTAPELRDELWMPSFASVSELQPLPNFNWRESLRRVSELERVE